MKDEGAEMNWLKRLCLPVKRIAAHEAGHALLAWRSPYVTKVAEVSLLRGRTTFFQVLGDSPDLLFDQIVIRLAGIAGELAVFGKYRPKGGVTDVVSAREWAEALAEHDDYSLWRLRRLIEAKPGPEGRPDVPTLDHEALFPGLARDIVWGILDRAYIAAWDGIKAADDAHARAMRALIENDRLDRSDLYAIFGPRP